MALRVTKSTFVIVPILHNFGLGLIIIVFCACIGRHLGRPILEDQDNDCKTKMISTALEGLLYPLVRKSWHRRQLTGYYTDIAYVVGNLSIQNIVIKILLS